LPARARVIDDFETAPFSITYTTPVGSQLNQKGLDSQHVLGGQRRPGFDIGSSAGSISLSSTSGDDGATLSVPSSNVGHWTTSYLDDIDDVDLAADGQNGIVITVSSAPAAGQIGLFAASGPGADAGRANALRPLTGPGEYVFPFDQMTPYPAEAMPNFHALDTLFLYVDGPSSSAPFTATVSDIRTTSIPEPSAARLLLLCAYSVRHRRVGKRL
jgi:hypothetical protein